MNCKHNLTLERTVKIYWPCFHNKQSCKQKMTLESTVKINFDMLLDSGVKPWLTITTPAKRSATAPLLMMRILSPVAWKKPLTVAKCGNCFIKTSCFWCISGDWSPLCKSDATTDMWDLRRDTSCCWFYRCAQDVFIYSVVRFRSNGPVSSCNLEEKERREDVHSGLGEILNPGFLKMAAKWLTTTPCHLDK